jgi:hypothetical protein
LKVVFFCSSLEPGCDGVGDYTRRLAGELLNLGHEVSIMALMDKHVMVHLKETQCSDHVAIPVFRIPRKYTHKHRFDLVKQWVTAINPNWLSLQYVTFSFHDKGLPFQLGKSLKSISHGKNWHIMFHELWVGSGTCSSTKHMIWGLVQRRIIQKMISSLQSKVIHTHSRLYIDQLNKLGYRVGRLPLFSNLRPLIIKHLKEKESSESTAVKMVTFGTLHTSLLVETFAKEVATFAKKEKINVLLHIVGRAGAEAQHWYKAWMEEGLEVTIVGEQTIEKTSTILAESDIGISTSALAMIEKSSAVATMQGHGLPVLCVANPWFSREVPNPVSPAGIFAYEPGNLADYLAGDRPVCMAPTVEDVAKRFLADLL